MDVNKLLDEIEDLIENRPMMGIKARPFRKVILDVDEMLDLTHQVRVALPQQIQRADQITREKDRLLTEAREQAERMVNEAADQADLSIRKAQEESRILVSSHEITRQSQQEGQRIVEQASQEAESIRQGALEYARGVLENLNTAVGNLAGHVDSLQQVAEKARDEIKA